MIAIYDPNHFKVVLLRGHDPLYPHNDPRVLKDCKSLKKAGLNPIVICWSKRLVNVPEDVTLPGEVPLIRIFHPIPGKEKNIISRYMAFRRVQEKLVNEVSRINPEIIHCYDLEMLEIGVKIKRRTGAFLCFVALEKWPLMERAESLGLYVASSFLERYLLRSVDHVITVNDHLAAYYSRYCPTTRVMNCAPYHWGENVPMEEIQRVRQKLGLYDSFVVMHHGNLTDFKGMRKLLDVAKRLKWSGELSNEHKGSRRGIRFVAIGPCPEKERYIRELKEDGLESFFLILDPVPFDLLPRYLHIADVNTAMLTPIHMNLISTPVKTLEAMNCSIPVQVNSECPMISEIVKEERCGVRCSHNTETIARSLIWMRDHPVELDRMGRAGRRAAERKYNWEREARKMDYLYNDVLGRGLRSSSFSRGRHS